MSKYATWGPNNPSWKGDEIGYGPAHRRVSQQRGKASDHSCVVCGGRAQNWAYDHKDPNERREKGLTYSTDVNRYQPMCISCHRTMDADHKGQARCGTYAGYFRHRRRKEQPCQSCKAACAAHSRRKKAERKAAPPDGEEFRAWPGGVA